MATVSVQQCRGVKGGDAGHDDRFSEAAEAESCTPVNTARPVRRVRIGATWSRSR